MSDEKTTLFGALDDATKAIRAVWDCTTPAGQASALADAMRAIERARAAVPCSSEAKNDELPLAYLSTLRHSVETGKMPLRDALEAACIIGRINGRHEMLRPSNPKVCDCLITEHCAKCIDQKHPRSASALQKPVGDMGLASAQAEVIRLRAAVMKLEDQWIEQQSEIARLRSASASPVPSADSLRILWNLLSCIVDENVPLEWADAARRLREELRPSEASITKENECSESSGTSSPASGGGLRDSSANHAASPAVPSAPSNATTAGADTTAANTAGAAECPRSAEAWVPHVGETVQIRMLDGEWVNDTVVAVHSDSKGVDLRRSGTWSLTSQGIRQCRTEAQPGEDIGTPLDVWLVVSDQTITAFHTEWEARQECPKRRSPHDAIVVGPYNPPDDPRRNDAQPAPWNSPRRFWCDDCGSAKGVDRAIAAARAEGIALGQAKEVGEVLDSTEAVIRDGEVDFDEVTTPEKAKEAQLELIAHIRDQLADVLEAEERRRPEAQSRSWQDGMRDAIKICEGRRAHFERMAKSDAAINADRSYQHEAGECVQALMTALEVDDERRRRAAAKPEGAT